MCNVKLIDNMNFCFQFLKDESDNELVRIGYGNLCKDVRIPHVKATDSWLKSEGEKFKNHCKANFSNQLKKKYR